jgi:hypothetical protein
LTIEDTVKPMVSLNCFNGTENMYVGGMDHMATFLDWDDELKPNDIINLIIENCTHYRHHYEEGDLLVWDNVQVMHKAANDYEGARLLLRA